MNRSWVRFPQAAQIRLPGSGWAFCMRCLLLVACCGAAGVSGAVGCAGRAARCARGRRPAREPSAPRASLGASPRSPARPRHRPPAPQQVPTPPVGPASVLAHIAVELPNFACNSPTTLSNPEIRSLELHRFQTLLKLRLIELHASFLRGGRIGACWRCSGSPQTWCAVV